MSMPFDPLQRKIERLKTKFKRIEEQYIAETELLGEQDGAIEQQRVQTAERLEAEMNKIQKELNAAEKKLENRHIDALVDCLEDFWEPHQQTFEKIYLKLLPSGHYLRVQGLPHTLLAMVNAISTKITSDASDVYTPLIHFVGQLMTTENLCIPGLQDWLVAELARQCDSSTHAGDVNQCLQVMAELHTSAEQRCSCLLVRVTESGQQSAQSNQKQYTMQGWYISDVVAYRQTFDSVVNIHLPNDSPDKPQAFVAAALEENLRSLIDVSLDHSDGVPESLQIFLPPELMNEPIECWSSRPPAEESMLTLSCEHREGVFIRCDKRLTERRLRWMDWAERWRLLEQQAHEPTSDLLLSTDESGCPRVERQLMNMKKRVFGLKLTCLPQQPEKGTVKRNSFFSLLSQSAVPAALWVRQHSSEMGCEALIDDVVSADPLSEIPINVYTRRQLDDDFAGQHLALMWEDPHLLPPEFRHKPAA
ncbi:MAG: hypothetical protein AB8B99_24265 [Phormidesmis sp.]